MKRTYNLKVQVTCTKAIPSLFTIDQSKTIYLNIKFCIKVEEIKRHFNIFDYSSLKAEYSQLGYIV